MKVFVAGLLHETSSFSPITTSRRSFEDFDYYRPANGLADERSKTPTGYGAFIRAAQAAGHDVYASTFTFGQPSGPCNRADYEDLRDEILGDLERAGPFDMAFFFLHGAQMAQGYDDCEGDLLARARRIVGPDRFIGVLLDLHANVTQEMIENASVIAACRNYPHTDFDARAEHVFRLGERVMAGGAKPVTRYLPLPMMGMFYTTEPKMAAANDAAQALEDRSGVLSVSLIHGFAWSDMPSAGAGVLIATDGLRNDLEDDLRALSRTFFDAREETVSKLRSIDDVLTRVEKAGPDKAGRPFVIADACDNAGGGAGSDSNFILAEILRRGLRGFAIGLLWDPIAVDMAEGAGAGAEFNLRLGGKTGPRAGQPLDVVARVAALRKDLYQTGIGFHVPLGRVAALEIAGNMVVVCTVRGQIFSPTCFTDIGVMPNANRALVVKSSQHFYEQFAPLAREVLYCNTPGSLTLTFDPADYRKLRRPIWPIDAVSI